MIKAIDLAHAAPLIELLTVLDQETAFFLYEPNERPLAKDHIQKEIQTFINDGCRQMWVVEERASHMLLGMAMVYQGTLKRTEHTAYCVLGLRQASTGQGLGRRLLEQIEQWCRGRAVSRLELKVMVNNPRAIRLYESFGFEYEGTRRQSVRVAGVLVDELYYSKLLA